MRHFGVHPQPPKERAVWFMEDSTLYAVMGTFGIATGLWLIMLAVRRKPVPNWYIWLASGGALLSGASNIARSRMMMVESDIRRAEQQNQPPPTQASAPPPTTASAAIQSTNQQAPHFTPGA